MFNNIYLWIIENINNDGYEGVLLFMYDWVYIDGIEVEEMEEVFIRLMRYHMDKEFEVDGVLHYYIFIAKNFSYLFNLYSGSNNIELLRNGVRDILLEWIKMKRVGYNFKEFYYILS